MVQGRRAFGVFEYKYLDAICDECSLTSRNDRTLLLRQSRVSYRDRSSIVRVGLGDSGRAQLHPGWWGVAVAAANRSVVLHALPETSSSMDCQKRVTKPDVFSNPRNSWHIA